MIRIVSAALMLLVGSAATSRAQEASYSFAIAQLPGNIQGCIAMDPAFNRPMTLKVEASGAAELRGTGGIHGRMKLVRPNVYEGTLEVSGAQLEFVADLGAAPKTMNVTSRNLGCKWRGTAR